MPTFPVTRWTLIVTAGKGDDAAAREALAELCRAYWYPVYAFIRRSGKAPDSAEDLTQSFFARLVEKRNFSYADPSKGRFRSFLLTSVKNFLIDEADYRKAEKRGAGVIPIDPEAAENRYRREFADEDTPEVIYEREWARTLVARVDVTVQKSLAREGKGEQFERLRRFLPGGEEGASYASVASDTGSSASALKVAVHRLRRRYREMFRAEISHLVADPALIDDEIHRLLEILRG